MPGSPNKKATQAPPSLAQKPKPRIKADLRKRMVAEYVSIYGVTDTRTIVKYIRSKTGKPVKDHTIAQDIEELHGVTDNFQRELARSTWMAKVHEMYADTNIEIKKIQTVTEKMLDADPNLPTGLLKLLEQMEDPKEQRQIIEYLKKLRSSADAQKILGKLAYATQVLNEKRAFLISLVTSVPLYNQTASLAKFYEQHTRE